MGINSYAQNFEDVMLWRALGHIQQGFYIDVGAQHPVTDSVSKAFYEKGWRGIHVEATPFYAGLLRRDRPDELVIEAAVSDSSGTLCFFEIPGSGISTGDPKIAQGHRKRGFDVREIVVPCITLATVFDLADGQEIHWLKIDVEFMEPMVLNSWGDSPARPWVVVVESTEPLSQTETRHLWEDKLFSRGYTHAYFDGLNRFYVAEGRNELLAAFVSGPNVFDKFVLLGGAAAALSANLNGRQKHEFADLAAQISTQRLHIRSLQDEQAAAVGAQKKQQKKLTQKIDSLERQLENLTLEAKTQLNEQRLIHQERERGLQVRISNQEVHARDQELAHRTEIAALNHLHVQQQFALQQQLKSIEAQAQEHARELEERWATRLDKATFQLQSQLDAQRLDHQDRENQMQAQIDLHQKQARDLELTYLTALAANDQSHTQEILQLQAEMLSALKQAHEREIALRRQAVQDLAQANQVTQAILTELIQREKVWAQSIQKALELRQDLVLASVNREAEWKQALQRLLLGLKNLHEATEQKKHLSQEPINAQSANPEHLDVALQSVNEYVERLQIAMEQAFQDLRAIQSHWSWRLLARLFKKHPLIPNPLPLIGSTSSLQSCSAAASRLEQVSSQWPEISQMNLPKTSIEQALPAAFSKSAQTSNSLGDLLSRHGQDFVYCAYQTLFGRAPDDEGFSYYMGKLQQGYSGLWVLAQMRQSSEGRNNATVFPGLDKAISRYRRAHWPVVGPSFRRLAATEDDRPQSRHWRHVSQQLALLDLENRRCSHRIGLALNHLEQLALPSNEVKGSHADAQFQAEPPTHTPQSWPRLPKHAGLIFQRFMNAGQSLLMKGN